MPRFFKESSSFLCIFDISSRFLGINVVTIITLRRAIPKKIRRKYAGLRRSVVSCFTLYNSKGS
jgi:hypothetical protein